MKKLMKIIKRIFIGICLIFVLLIIVAIFTSDTDDLQNKSDDQYNKSIEKNEATEESIPEATTEKVTESQKTETKDYGTCDMCENEPIDEQIFPGSDHRYISEDELNSKSKAELRLGRNEIYARHNYVFESQDLLDYFGSTSWYEKGHTAKYEDQNNIVLNDYEKQNIIMIQNKEHGTSSETTNTTKKTYTNPEINETDVPTSDYHFSMLDNPTEGEKVKLYGTMIEDNSGYCIIKLENGVNVRCDDSMEEGYNFSDYASEGDKIVVFASYFSSYGGHTVEAEWCGTPAL